MLSRIRESISESASRSKKRMLNSTKKLETQKERSKPKKLDEKVGENSPWDPTPRRRVNYSDLDLKKNYLKDKGFMKYFTELRAKETGKTKLGKRQRRWSHFGQKPLTDYKLLPEGWNSGEPDLSPDDIQGQIDRCKERIHDNIFPHIFERRLEEFEKKKAEILKLQDCEPEGLSILTLQRIKSLEEIVELLEAEGDEQCQIDNILGILEAYRRKSLEWTGLVTYWSHGKQLCQPRPFDWDEFEAINEKYNGHKDFWVEGNEGPTLPINNARLEVVRRSLRLTMNDMYAYRIAFRRPAGADDQRYWHEVEVVYDTASSLTQLSHDDLRYIAGPFMETNEPPAHWPTLGTSVVTGLQRYTVDLVEMEVTVLTRSRHRMCPWMRTVVAIPRAEITNNLDWMRTDGVAMRSLFYYATTPSAGEELVIADTELALHLPKAVKPKDRPRHYRWRGLGPNRVDSLDTRPDGGNLGRWVASSAAPTSDPEPAIYTPEFASRRSRGATRARNERESVRQGE